MVRLYYKVGAGNLLQSGAVPTAKCGKYYNVRQLYYKDYKMRQILQTGAIIKK